MSLYRWVHFSRAVLFCQPHQQLFTHSLRIMSPRVIATQQSFHRIPKAVVICWACIHTYIHSIFLPPFFACFSLLHHWALSVLLPFRQSLHASLTTAITGSDIANGGQVMHVNIWCVWVWNSSIKIPMIWTSAQLVWTFTQTAAENLQHTLKCLLLQLLLS